MHLSTTTVPCAPRMMLSLVYELVVQGTSKSMPECKNGNCGNQRGNGNAPAKVYVVGNVGTNPDSNIVTSTFLLKDRYASILFDTGANRSLVSTAFSSYIDLTTHSSFSPTIMMSNSGRENN
ncbi:putative reverse transcriptase domain-containing protein [Tanacetum coccineum]